MPGLVLSLDRSVHHMDTWTLRVPVSGLREVGVQNIGLLIKKLISVLLYRPSWVHLFGGGFSWVVYLPRYLYQSRVTASPTVTPWYEDNTRKNAPDSAADEPVG